MSLDYYAFREHKNLLAMGLHKMDPDDWILPDKKLPAQTSVKKSLWSDLGDRVYSQLPQSHEAQREVAETLGSYLPKQFPELYAPHPNGLICRFNDTAIQWDDSPEETLLNASWCVQEDVCLLQPLDDQYVLTAASVCAPSYWRLLEKIGHPLDQIHAPVPGYSQQLSKKINRFFRHIKVDRPVWRGNWSIVTSDRLYQPGNEESVPITQAEDIPQQCYIRTERQTLMRLPLTKAVVFTIRVQITPFTHFTENRIWLSDLLQAVQTLSADERNYKSLRPIEPALTRWLENHLTRF